MEIKYKAGTLLLWTIHNDAHKASAVKSAFVVLIHASF